MTEHIATLFDLPTNLVETLHQHNTKVTNFNSLTTSDYADISIIIGWDERIGNAILDTPNSKLRWIQTHSAGVDYLPKDKIIAKNIIVTNASGVHSQPISQSVIGDILFFARGFNKHYNNTLNKNWSANVNSYLISDFTFLIFGTGHIGRELAKNLTALHGTVLGINHSGHAVAGFDKTFAITDYAQAVKQADVIINILPGTEETYHFFNTEFFEKINNKFMFINVGRGFSVENNAFIDAMHAHRFKYAALDVVDPEPLPIDSKLWDIPNILITGHSTGQVADYNLRVAKIFADNLPSFFKDGSFIRNVVDLNRGY